VFKDRIEVGRNLAQKLLPLKKGSDLVVAIPRGGIIVGYEISRLLKLPLVPLVVKKVPTLGEPELAAGAVGPEGFSTGKKSRKIEKMVSERIERYDSQTDFEEKRIILTDDGVATGATIETAIFYLKEKKAALITVAVPVVTKNEFERLGLLADRVVALTTPDEFTSIGEFYENFTQVTDEEVIQLLHRQK